MTINKSQGQSLERVGIYLEQPVFSHGMLYVAFSRATSAEAVTVYVNETETQGKLLAHSDLIFTPNVIYREVFTM